MKLPFFQRVKKQRLYKINGFSGLNKTPACKVHEFSDEENLSTKNYPAMSPISPEVVFIKDIADIFLYENESYKITKNGEFYKGNKKISEGFTTDVHEFSVLGTKLIIMPDKIYYDMEKDIMGSMDSVFEGIGVFCEGTVFGESGRVDCLNTEMEMTKYFKEGDCVELWCDGQSKGFFTISAIKGGVIKFEYAYFEISHSEMSVVLKRTVPPLENTFECNNRLWGTMGNSIYASALGDPFNFYRYRGISTDSYFKEIYSQGKFTAGVALGETPVFFKERAIYRVYGDIPEGFYLDIKEAIGVSDGCRHSAVCLDGAIYYAGSDGIYAYSSAYPTRISDKLGILKVGKAVGGTDGRRYYVSFSDFDGVRDDITDVIRAYHECSFYSFDTATGLWHKFKDGMMIKRIVTGHYGSVFKKLNTLALDETGDLFSISDKLSGTLVDSLSGENVKKISSFGISGLISFDTRAEIYSVGLTLQLPQDSEFYGEISYDGGEFIPFCSLNGGNEVRKTYVFRVPKRIFSVFRLKFGGVGEYELSAVDVYYRKAHNESGASYTESSDMENVLT